MLRLQLIYVSKRGPRSQKLECNTCYSNWIGLCFTLVLLWQTKSLPCLMMSWSCASPGHLQPWYILYKQGLCLPLGNGSMLRPEGAFVGFAPNWKKKAPWLQNQRRSWPIIMYYLLVLGLPLLIKGPLFLEGVIWEALKPLFLAWKLIFQIPAYLPQYLEIKCKNIQIFPQNISQCKVFLGHSSFEVIRTEPVLGWLHLIIKGHVNIQHIPRNKIGWN